MPNPTKVEMAGAYERRVARASVEKFLAGLPRQRTPAQRLHEQYVLTSGSYPMSLVNFGRLLVEMEVPRCRTRTGIVYIPN